MHIHVIPSNVFHVTNCNLIIGIDYEQFDGVLCSNCDVMLSNHSLSTPILMVVVV